MFCAARCQRQLLEGMGVPSADSPVRKTAPGIREKHEMSLSRTVPKPHNWGHLGWRKVMQRHHSVSHAPGTSGGKLSILSVLHSEMAMIDLLNPGASNARRAHTRESAKPSLRKRLSLGFKLPEALYTFEATHTNRWHSPLVQQLFPAATTGITKSDA